MKIRGQRVIPPVERIMKFVAKDAVTGCWNWTGTVRSQKKPYGHLFVGSRTDGTRRNVGAHRYSFEVFRHEIKDPEMCVCHTCDNPRCVNPEHLFLGTKKDNSDDRDAKGRNIIQVGAKNGQAKLTDEIVADFLSSAESGASVARRLGIDRSTVNKIRRGTWWKHIPRILPAPPTQEG